jgi:hypothetical protein
MLSPKNHIRGKCTRNATIAGIDYAAAQPSKKAGVSPAFFAVGWLRAAISILR